MRRGILVGGSYLGKFTLSGNCVLDNPMGIERKTTYINICSPKGSQKTLWNLCSNNNKCRPPIQNPHPKKIASALLPVPLTPNQEKNPIPWKITDGHGKIDSKRRFKGQDHPRVLAWSFFVWSLPYVHVPAHLGGWVFSGCFFNFKLLGGLEVWGFWGLWDGCLGLVVLGGWVGFRLGGLWSFFGFGFEVKINNFSSFWTWIGMAISTHIWNLSWLVNEVHPRNLK